MIYRQINIYIFFKITFKIFFNEFNFFLKKKLVQFLQVSESNLQFRRYYLKIVRSLKNVRLQFLQKKKQGNNRVIEL